MVELTRHAARAVPWAVVGTGCVAVAVLMALSAAWPESVWPLQGTAVGLMAGIAAWSMDERAAAVVDTLPRSLRWRTLARAIAALPPAAVWIACILVAGARLPDHPRLFVLQGLTALLAGAATATWLRSRGSATPGLAVAPAVIGVTCALALLRPFPDRLPLFPIWPGEAWRLSVVIWLGLLATSALVLLAALRTPRPAAR